MKKRTLFKIGTLVGILSLVLIVAGGTCLAGGIVSVHGHSGAIQYLPNILSSDSDYFMGYGLEIMQDPGTGNWIHYSIPTPPVTSTRYILVRYETGLPGNFADSFIGQIHVYDGGTQIYGTGFINLNGGPDFYIIDMGEDKLINWGLGVSIGVTAGTNSKLSHRIVIYALWAEWH